MRSEKNHLDNPEPTSEQTSPSHEDTGLDSFADDLLKTLPTLNIFTDTTEGETSSPIQPEINPKKGKGRQIDSENPGLGSMQSISEAVDELFEDISPPPPVSSSAFSLPTTSLPATSLTSLPITSLTSLSTNFITSILTTPLTSLRTASPAITVTPQQSEEDELIQPTSISRDGTIRFKKLSTLNAYENIETQKIRLALGTGKIKSNLTKKNNRMKPYLRRADGPGDNRSNRRRNTNDIDDGTSNVSAFYGMMSGGQRGLYSNSPTSNNPGFGGGSDISGNSKGCAEAPKPSSGHRGLSIYFPTFNNPNDDDRTDNPSTSGEIYNTLYSNFPSPFVQRPVSIFGGDVAESSSHDNLTSNSMRNITKSSDDMKEEILKYYQQAYSDNQTDIIDYEDSNEEQNIIIQGLLDQKLTNQDPPTQDFETQDPSMQDPPSQNLTAQEPLFTLDSYIQNQPPQYLPSSYPSQCSPQQSILVTSKIQEPSIFNATTSLLYPGTASSYIPGGITQYRDGNNPEKTTQQTFTTQDNILKSSLSLETAVNTPRKNPRDDDYKLERSRKSHKTEAKYSAGGIDFSGVTTRSKHPKDSPSSSSEEGDELELHRKVLKTNNNESVITLGGSIKTVDKEKHEWIMKNNEVVVPQTDLFKCIREPQSSIIIGLVDVNAELALKYIAIVLGTTNSDMKTTIYKPINSKPKKTKLSILLFPSVVNNIKNGRLGESIIFTKHKLQKTKEVFLYDEFLGRRAFQEKEDSLYSDPIQEEEEEEEGEAERLTKNKRRRRKMALSKFSLSQSMMFAAEEKGYTMTPSYETLIKMTKSELTSIRLKVGRKGYGEILYESVNLSHVDLTLIMHYLVRFENRKEVVVYPDVTKKPEVGCGLNVPALITLENCFEVRDPKSTHVRAFVMKLKELKDTGFVSYDPGLAKWKFRVDHF